MNLNEINTSTSEEKKIVAFLIDESQKDIYLNNAISSNTLDSINDLMIYVYEQARSLASGKKSIIVDDDVVFSWCKDFFIDYENIAAKKKETKKSVTEPEKKEAVVDPEPEEIDLDDFEKKFKPSSKPKATSKKATSKSASKSANPKVDKPVVAVVSKRDKADKQNDKQIGNKNSNKAYEQMSIFDLIS